MSGLDNPSGEESFSNIQPEPALTQLEATSSCLVSLATWEKGLTSTRLQAPFRQFVESDKVPLPQVKQT